MAQDWLVNHSAYFDFMKKNPASAFTLVEMLAVLGIIGIMLGLSLPALMSLSNQAGRKAAVDLLLNTFEQTRVQALQTGQRTHIVFADQSVPLAEMQYRAFAILQDKTDEEKAANPSDTSPYKFLTKWEYLPKGISFKYESQSLVGTGTSYTLAVPKSPLFGGGGLPALTFNSTGAIEQPNNYLRVFIYEGFFSPSPARDNFTRRQTDMTSMLYEQISFSRFTGRAQLDITTVQ
jgi:prepilin-type N-terminal cleavage/methylation domain-containing protein